MFHAQPFSPFSCISFKKTYAGRGAQLLLKTGHKWPAYLNIFSVTGRLLMVKKIFGRWRVPKKVSTKILEQQPVKNNNPTEFTILGLMANFFCFSYPSYPASEFITFLADRMTIFNMNGLNSVIMRIFHCFLQKS